MCILSLAFDMSGSEDKAPPVMKAEFGCLLTAMVGIQEQVQLMKGELTEERKATNKQLLAHQARKSSVIHKKGPQKAVSV